MPRSLRDMNVLITGASAGIGAALARELHTRGARLVLSARRADRLDALNAELGGTHLVVPGDIASPDDCARLIDTAFARLGRLDTLVLNAGYGEMRPVIEMTPDRVNAMFATNLLGTTEPIRLALPKLLQQQPRDGYRAQIMIVSSAAARRGLPFYGVYSATKAAQLSVAEALRVELSDAAIPVTSVHPVGTTTEFFDVAQTKGGRVMPARMKGDVTQSPAHVASRMTPAIERPTREVWPYRPARFALSLVTLFPSLGDAIMKKARGSMGN